MCAMDLKSILSGLEGLKVKGSLDVEVNEIRNSSNLVQKGDMFVAIDGFDTDGHQYIGEAIQKGAKVIMAQADKITKEMVKELPENVTFILAPDTRHAVSICACNFYKNYTRKSRITTTFEQNGGRKMRCGSYGSIFSKSKTRQS